MTGEEGVSSARNVLSRVEGQAEHCGGGPTRLKAVVLLAGAGLSILVLARRTNLRDVATAVASENAARIRSMKPQKPHPRLSEPPSR